MNPTIPHRETAVNDRHSGTAEEQIVPLNVGRISQSVSEAGRIWEIRPTAGQ